MSPAAAGLRDRLAAIGDAVQTETHACGSLRDVLTRTASALFTHEELPRYLQVQLARDQSGIPSWQNLTGERMTRLGLPHFPGGVRVDDCGTVIPTLVPVTIDYAVLVDGRQVCGSAESDSGVVQVTFEDGIHRTTMSPTGLSVVRSAFTHTLMDIPFAGVSFALENTSAQFHTVTLVLLIKPFDEDGLTSINRFSLDGSNILNLNGTAVAFARERPSRTMVRVYDADTAAMIPAPSEGEVVAPTGLMQVRLEFEHQLEADGTTDIAFFFFADPARRPRREDLTLLLGQHMSILEQERRLVVTQGQHLQWRTGLERLNRFADHQLLHLPSLQTEALSAVATGPDPIALPALVQGFDRIGDIETASSLLRTYADLLPAEPVPSSDCLLAYASLAVTLGWHLRVTRQVALRRQLLPVIDKFVTWLSAGAVTLRPVALRLLGPLRRGGPLLYQLLAKAIESYQGMLPEREQSRIRLCEDLQLKILRKADGGGSIGDVRARPPGLANIDLVVAYTLFGAHGTEDSILQDILQWIDVNSQQDGVIENPYAGALGDMQLSLVCEKALLLRQDSLGLTWLVRSLNVLNEADALPDFVDLRSRKAKCGSRHSAVATACAIELLTSLIVVERGSYLSIFPIAVPALFEGTGVEVQGLLSTFGELSVQLSRQDDKARFSLQSDFLRGVSAIEINMPWDIKELVARKGIVKYVSGGTIVMEPADTIEVEAVV
jgi:hypothetical protein